MAGVLPGYRMARMWVKLDDHWMDHPKIIRAGRDGRDLWLAGLTYCAKHLTDGFIPAEALPMLAVMAGIDVANCQTFARTLLDVGLWIATDTGYAIHDYAEYNPTKEQVLATKEARREAGRRGGDAKASKQSGKMLANDKQNSSKSLPRTRTRTNNGCDLTVTAPDDPKTTSQHNELFGAICEATGQDPSVLSEMQRKEISDAAKSFERARYTAADIAVWRTSLWTSKFPGNRGDLPTVKQMRAGIGQLRSNGHEAKPYAAGVY